LWTGKNRDRNKNNRIQPVYCLSSVKKKTRTIQDNKNNTPGILSEDLMLTTFGENKEMEDI
jgi:hypothetical protein